MKLTNHAKFKEKLACGLEHDKMNLAHYQPNTWKIETLMGSFCPQ